MAPVVIGLLLATAWLLGSAHSNPATDWPLWLLTAVCALLVWRTRLHLLWLLGAGALLGALGDGDFGGRDLLLVAFGIFPAVGVVLELAVRKLHVLVRKPQTELHARTGLGCRLGVQRDAIALDDVNMVCLAGVHGAPGHGVCHVLYVTGRHLDATFGANAGVAVGQCLLALRRAQACRCLFTQFGVYHRGVRLQGLLALPCVHLHGALQAQGVSVGRVAGRGTPQRHRKHAHSDRTTA
jgi:hypothetical protein